MRLNEIKKSITGDVDLKEGVIPVHIVLTLEQVIRDGKVTNSVQTFIMAAMFEMFKLGERTRWPRDVNAYDMCTNAQLIEDTRALTDNEAVAISTWLLEALASIGSFESDPYAFTAYTNPSMNTQDWVRWVLKRQN